MKELKYSTIGLEKSSKVAFILHTLKNVMMLSVRLFYQGGIVQF